MDHRGSMDDPSLRWDEDDDRFEKFHRHSKPRLPVGSDKARRSAKETHSSKRIRKLISRTTGACIAAARRRSSR